ncbi:MAG: serine hydrolase domain-containing protein [Candidatus Binataceae bacterium]
MRRTTHVFAATFIVALICAFARPAGAEIAAGTRARIDEIASAPVSRGETPAIMVGVISGSDRMIRAFGSTAPGSGKRPTATTEWEIGSITKTFTAMLLALYVQRGLVRYKDPLQKYVPGGIAVPSYGGRQITLLDLATHTSGLPKDPNLRGVRHLEPAAMYRRLSAYRLTRAPGQQFEYSNWGFALLAHALMRVTGDDYQNLVEREICAPLGMVDTRIDLTPAELARQAQGYSPEGFPRSHDNVTWPAFNGAGALRSTMDDLMRYLAFNLCQTKTPLDALLPDLHKRRHRGGRAGTSVGLAWQILPMRGTDWSIIWKNGAASGFFSYIGFVKETGTGVIVLANRKASVGHIGTRILRILNGASSTIEQPPEQIDQNMEADEPRD